MTIIHRAELEERVRDIQRIKSEFYVGTKQAYEYLKLKQRVGDNKTLACNTINCALKDGAYYLATPERLHAMNKIFIDAQSVFLGFDAFQDEASVKQRRDLLTFFESYTSLSEATDFEDADVVVQHIGGMDDVFKRINIVGMRSDKDAFYFVRDEFIPGSLPELQPHEIFDVRQEIGEYFDFAEWYHDFYGWFDRYNKQEFLAMASAELLKKDRADGVFQFRRSIIEVMLPDLLACTRAEAPDKMYAKIIDSVEDDMKTSRDLASPKEGAFWPDGIPLYADKLRFERFVRFLLCAEKSYVMKYIKAYLGGKEKQRD
ncbi:hypothetical protein HY484_02970 [Candidatus Woesearchaeota archaeon]|nr:hypothetical protein [Candidatus Woesearchaeota archaeon]